MKMLRLLCSAVVLAAATACGEAPTAVKTEIAPARHYGGGFIGGGSRTSDADTLNVTNVSGDGTVSTTTCEELRGGVFGGGHYTAPQPCA